MSYKSIPYTYGVLEVSEINALTGMEEGDTVYNKDWQIVEIYSGTNWVNSQSQEFTTASATVIPPTGTIPSGDRSGNPYPSDGGYNISQENSSDSDVELGTDDQLDYIGCKIRGTSTSGAQERIVVAFSGKWDMFMENDANKGEFVVIDSTSPGGRFRSTTSASSDHVGSVVGASASSGSDTFRNYKCAVQTVELQ